jgi:hypothetical protein
VTAVLTGDLREWVEACLGPVPCEHGDELLDWKNARLDHPIWPIFLRARCVACGKQIPVNPSRARANGWANPTDAYFLDPFADQDGAAALREFRS